MSQITKVDLFTPPDINITMAGIKQEQLQTQNTIRIHEQKLKAEMAKKSSTELVMEGLQDGLGLVQSVQNIKLTELQQREASLDIKKKTQEMDVLIKRQAEDEHYLDLIENSGNEAERMEVINEIITKHPDAADPERLGGAMQVALTGIADTRQRQGFGPKDPMAVTALNMRDSLDPEMRKQNDAQAHSGAMQEDRQVHDRQMEGVRQSGMNARAAGREDIGTKQLRKTKTEFEEADAALEADPTLSQAAKSAGVDSVSSLLKEGIPRKPSTKELTLGASPKDQVLDITTYGTDGKSSTTSVILGTAQQKLMREKEASRILVNKRSREVGEEQQTQRSQQDDVEIEQRDSLIRQRAEQILDQKRSTRNLDQLSPNVQTQLLKAAEQELRSEGKI